MKMVFVIYVKNYKCIKCFLEPGVLSVAASYGVHHHIPNWSYFWPQPRDENWGHGFVIVTSHYRHLVETSNLYIRYIYKIYAVNFIQRNTLVMYILYIHCYIL